MSQTKQQEYRIKYTYDEPHGAGPFKGAVTSYDPVKKGEKYYAVFGRATVVSCSKVRSK